MQFRPQEAPTHPHFLRRRPRQRPTSPLAASRAGAQLQTARRPYLSTKIVRLQFSTVQISKLTQERHVRKSKSSQFGKHQHLKASRSTEQRVQFPEAQVKSVRAPLPYYQGARGKMIRTASTFPKQRVETERRPSVQSARVQASRAAIGGDLQPAGYFTSSAPGPAVRPARKEQ